jgi:hypothetical protein
LGGGDYGKVRIRSQEVVSAQIPAIRGAYPWAWAASAAWPMQSISSSVL